MVNSVLRSLLDNLYKSKSLGDKSLEEKALIKLGEYNYSNENFLKSRLYFKSALKTNPNLEGINYYLALIALQEEDKFLAKKYLKLELKLNSQNNLAIELLEKLNVSSNFPIITLFLVILNSIIFYFTSPRIGLLELIRFTTSNFDYSLFNLISSLFFHINLLHFSINMVFLIMFGLILEKLIGSFKFLTIFLIGGVLGNLAQILMVQDSFVLGASCGIFAIIGGVLMREPLLKIRIIGLFKVSLVLVLGIFFILSNFLTVFITKNQFVSGDLGHLIGFLIGMLITGIFYRKTRFVFYNWIVIACGFWLIISSLEILILKIVDFKTLLILILSTTLGTFLVVFSYIKLKIDVLRGRIK